MKYLRENTCQCQTCKMAQTRFTGQTCRMLQRCKKCVKLVGETEKVCKVSFLCVLLLLLNYWFYAIFVFFSTPTLRRKKQYEQNLLPLATSGPLNKNQRRNQDSVHRIYLWLGRLCAIDINQYSCLQAWSTMLFSLILHFYEKILFQ